MFLKNNKDIEIISVKNTSNGRSKCYSDIIICQWMFPTVRQWNTRLQGTTQETGCIHY